ncbi:MAG: porin family protein [Gelidibacter sp.]
MKKQLLIAGFVAFFLFNAHAQNDKGTFELGGSVGLNLSTVDVPSDYGSNANTKVALNIAAIGEYYFSDRWGIKTRLIYDQKGWADGYVDTEDGYYVTDYNINYLTIPVMANWHFGSTRKWHLNFGPYVGFLLNAKDKEKGMDFKDAFSSTDFGLAFGIGYKFPIADNTKLFIEYEEQYGFIDIFAGNAGGSDVVNSRSSFNVGVLFNL